MTEKLPNVDTSRFPALTIGYVRTIDVGALMGRIYAAGGAFPMSWNAFRAWGPTRARFDHQPSPRREHPTRRVSYVAPTITDPTGDVYPVLKICLAECFRDRGIIETHRDDPYFTLFETQRPLQLLDLSDSDWVTVAGGNGAIASGSHARALAWARAIYRTYPRLDGMVYASSNIPPARAIVLWERAEDALPARPAFNEPLAHTGLAAALETYAAELRLGLA